MMHTPGPWSYQEKADAYTHIVRSPTNRLIVQLAQDTNGTAEANARLIAAAPELLEACLMVDVLYTSYGLLANSAEAGVMINAVRDAIAKAEGA